MQMTAHGLRVVSAATANVIFAKSA